MRVTKEMIDKGAEALVLGGLISSETGDVLHDYDWTPYEAAEAVLLAAIEGILPERVEKDDEGTRART